MHLGRREEAIRALDAVVDRLADTSAPRLREHAAVALNNKAVVLSELDCEQAVLTVLDEVITRFHDIAAQVLTLLRHAPLRGRRQPRTHREIPPKRMLVSMLITAESSAENRQ
jgi:hypothetical protein